MFRNLKINPFIALIIFIIILSNIFPIAQRYIIFFKIIAQISISLLFLIHGAKLSKEALLSGVTNIRMHLVILIFTFVFFPCLGIFLTYIIPSNILKLEFINGFLFLCALPSTVQSSIVFTSIARGNISGSICSASLSTLLGIILSPLLFFFLLKKNEMPEIKFLETISSLFFQMILPFLIGFLLQKKITPIFKKLPRLIKTTDYFSILLVIYITFSESINNGTWIKTNIKDLFIISLICILILFTVIFSSILISRWFGFSKEDEITIVFCSSKKSMISGIPMASILFAPSSISFLILPLILFHQIQLIFCAFIAQKYAQRYK